MALGNKNRITKVILMQHHFEGDIAYSHRRNCQQDQWQRHHPRRLVRLAAMMVVVSMIVMHGMMVVMRHLVIALLAMKYQEVHAERIERGDEHAGHHREVGET